jgi:hypothetical protein
VARLILRAIFLGGTPYLLGVDVSGEAGHYPLARSAEHDHARIARQVEGVAGWQIGGVFVVHAVPPLLRAGMPLLSFVDSSFGR